MASEIGHAVPIKDEPSDSLDALPDYNAESPSLKRRRSDQSQDLGEKRQRVESSADIQSPDLDALLAQAATASVQPCSILANGEANNSSISCDDHCCENGQHAVGSHSSAFISDPYLSMRVMSLPILESLSTQIIATLAQGPYYETYKLISTPDSELGQAFATMTSLFEQTKKMYSQDACFLSADELNITGQEHRETIRTTNLATFVSGVFSQKLGFYELEDAFVNTFTPHDVPLQKEPGELLINLKTQMYLSAVSEQGKTKEETLDETFPNDIEKHLARRHPDNALSWTERDFMTAHRQRREYLMKESSDPASILSLSEQFPWESFLESLSVHLSRAYGPLLAPYMKRHALTAPAGMLQCSRNSSIQHSHIVNSIEQVSDDFSALISAATDSIVKSFEEGTGQSQSSQVQQQQPQIAPYQSDKSDVAANKQSAPTQELYRRARQAAASRPNTQSKKAGLLSQRRPWSQSEEEALMTGLDQVRGPHWSQILALYGNEGTISDVLKDRNQVQLKDKARNLKLFFLKADVEVPYHLQCVTGDLKTRAPTQAARKEAEERAHLAGEDERARINGINILGALHQGRDMAFARVNGQDSSPGSQRSESAAMSHDGSGASHDDPEELRVISQEPESYQGVSSPVLNDDERLQQALMAANASSDDHSNGFRPMNAPMASMT